MSRRAWWLALCSAPLATPATTSAVALADEVTIRVRVYVNEGTKTRELEVTGNIASRAVGETVDLLAKPSDEPRCGGGGVTRRSSFAPRKAAKKKGTHGGNLVSPMLRSGEGGI
jgi:hypothetical protein